jgi:thiol:disulfide interchange protein
MNQAMKPVWGLFAALVVVTAVALLTRALQRDEIIPWRTSYPAALDEGRANGKRVLVYFTATWCAPCQNLRHTTWADKDVEAALRNFVPVKVDVDEQHELALKYRVDAVPTFVVLEPDGATVKTTWSGASPPEEFVNQLHAVGPATTQAVKR